MISPAKFSESSTLLWRPSGILGYPLLYQKRMFGGALRVPVLKNLERCGMGLRNRVSGVVVPALEIHSKGAVDAIKAGEVIAVPTDTLYGFACDAWNARRSQPQMWWLVQRYLLRAVSIVKLSINLRQSLSLHTTTLCILLVKVVLVEYLTRPASLTKPFLLFLLVYVGRFFQSSAEAVHRIYEIKERKHTNPLAICVADVSDIPRFALTDHLPQGLLVNLLPGPVTVVLRRGDFSALEKSLNPGFDRIGIRVPENNFIRAIARGAGSALALTSANLSGQPSSVNIKDFEDLWRHCAYVYDGGLLPSGRAGSTVVDLVMPRTYRILRPGSARKETTKILERFGLEEDAG